MSDPPVKNVSISEAVALALQHQQAGRLVQAEQLCQQILRQHPSQVAALHLLGLVAAQRQQFDRAIDYYRQVLALQADHLEAHNNLGIALVAWGDVDQAIDYYHRALALDSQIPEIWVNLGNALQEKAALEEAIDAYQQALTLKTLAAAYKNRAHVLRMQGKLDQALADHQQAIVLKPDDPDAHFGYAFTQLIAGELQSGFAEYEWRWRLRYNPPRTFEQPRWDGSPLAGRSILLHAEQGLGDTLQFVRYAALLAEQGQVIVECQKPLVRLLAAIPGIQTIAQGDALPTFDCHAPLLSLPHLLGTTLATIPAPIPYLQPPADPLQVKPDARFRPIKIGIVWAGDPKNPINRRRSCPLPQFLKLLDIPGVTLYSLQKGAEAAELNEFAHPRLIDLSSRLQDFADTAAIVAQLDLVIAIDTAVAHLAGAIGQRVWVILPFAPDWRWLMHREDSPWYPTMRLFRQPAPGEWSAVFEQITHLLSESVGQQFLPPATKPRRLGIGWQLNPTLGWGVYGTNLTLQLLRHPDWEPVLLLPPAMETIAHPLHRWQLRLLETWQRDITATSCDFPVLFALSNEFTTLEATQAMAQPRRRCIDSPRKIGVVFFENSHLSPQAIARAKTYDRLITGSAWNEQILRQHGIENLVTVYQGIDPTIFHPVPRSTLFADRFVVFSGGKLEYRKGQDIAIAAFRQFRDRHPEALLMVAWHNYWTQFMAGMEQIGHTIGLPNVANGQLQIVEWLVQNGIPAGAVIDLGLTANALMGQLLSAADVAIFPNRAEGGTNLVAMEALACGVPTILSANTGHLDLIGKYTNENPVCYPLQQQTQVRPTTLFPNVDGWGEPSVEELVDRLEQVYVNRHNARQKGIAAAQLMQDWTWEKQTQQLLDAIDSLI